MDPMTAIILADAFSSITIQLIQAAQSSPKTTEEQQAKIEELKARLADTLSKVMAYQPRPDNPE